MRLSSPFGSRSRTQILLALRQLHSSYPRALSRLLDSPIFAVRKALQGLERDGLVSSRLVGRTRVYTLDAGYPAHAELAAYLARLATTGDGELAARIDRQREQQAAAGRGLRTQTPPPASGRAQIATAGRAAPRPRDDGWRNW